MRRVLVLPKSTVQARRSVQALPFGALSVAHRSQ
jgi:hypothetical protein